MLIWKRGQVGSLLVQALRTTALTAIVLTTWLAATAARAGEPILLQSHAGAPPEDAEYYISQLVRSMGEEAPVHGEALKRAIETHHSLPAGTQVPPKGIRQMVAEGRKHFIQGKFSRAIAKLEAARRLLLKEVAQVASNQTLRDSLHQALLYLAHAYLRGKQGDKATERVSEVIRSFPDRDLSLARYGPDLASFYRKVRRELTRQQRGTLAITTEPSGCLVFVNERFVGLSPARVTDLLPGRYRIYVQRPGKQGRIHLITLNGGDHQVTINFELDRVLRSGAFVGFRFDDRRSKDASEVMYAAALARAVDAPTALLLGFHRYQGRRTLQGTAVSADTGRVIRSGMVALEPAAPSPKTLQALGQFLLAGKQSSDLIIRSAASGLPGAGSADRGTADDSGGGFFSARVFKWITLGVAVAGLAAGITLIALDGTGTCDTATGGLCPERYETMAPGVALTAVGGAAAITSGVLFVIDARGSSSARSAAILPFAGRRGVGVAAHVSF
jgi:hypothetical protein